MGEQPELTAGAGTNACTPVPTASFTMANGGHSPESMDEGMDGWMEGQRDKWMEGQRDRGTEGRMDRGTEGRMDRGIDG